MNFNIEDEYQKYLELVSLDEMTMSPVQRMETRRAFVAGYGMCFVKMGIESPDLPENEAYELFMDIQKGVAEFYNNQAKTKKHGK